MNSMTGQLTSRVVPSGECDRRAGLLEVDEIRQVAAREDPSGADLLRECGRGGRARAARVHPPREHEHEHGRTQLGPPLDSDHDDHCTR